MKKILATLFCITLSAWAIPCLSMTTIVAWGTDLDVYGSGGVGSATGDATREYFMVGDKEIVTPSSPGRRGIIQFSLLSETGLPIAPVHSARLKLSIVQSHKDTSSTTGDGASGDETPPFTDPGLGATRAIHIAQHNPADPGASYGAPSIGNDSGSLIWSGAAPGSSVSVDVTKAIQQALEAGSASVTFRIQTDTESDGDGRDDTWHFASANNLDPVRRPIIEITEVNGPRILWLDHNRLLASGGIWARGRYGFSVSTLKLEEISVYTAVPVPEGKAITGVRLCYKVYVYNVNSSTVRNFISRIRLSQVQDPAVTASVRLDDETNLTDPGPICVNSQSTRIDSSAGPVLLDLLLNFGDTTDRIDIIGLGVFLEATE